MFSLSIVTGVFAESNPNTTFAAKPDFDILSKVPSLSSALQTFRYVGLVACLGAILYAAIRLGFGFYFRATTGGSAFQDVLTAGIVGALVLGMAPHLIQTYLEGCLENSVTADQVKRLPGSCIIPGCVEAYRVRRLRLSAILTVEYLASIRLFNVTAHLFIVW